MDHSYRLAGQGLQKVFIGQILCLFAFIPYVGPVLSVVGLVFHLLGLYTAKSAHPGFQTAFNVAAAGVIVALLSIFIPLLNVAASILNLTAFYYICTAASELLASKGDAYQANRGLNIRKLYFGCMIVMIFCLILSFVPLLGILAAIVLVIASIVQLAAGILYLIFLYKAQQSLQS